MHTLRNITAIQGHKTFINLLGLVFITTETHDGKLGLHHPRIHSGNPDTRAVEFVLQNPSESLNAEFTRAISPTIFIGLMTRNRTDQGGG